MSACAPVGECTSSRAAFARTSAQTAACATPRSSGAALSRSAFTRRSDGEAVCGAGANAALRADHRPSSTHDTGTFVSRAGGASTVTLRIRFCFAPSSSSPSYSRTLDSSGLVTRSSGTEPASLTSVTRSPSGRASSRVTYAAFGCRRGNSGAIASPPWATGSPSWMVVSIIATSFRRPGITRTSDSPYAGPRAADDETVGTAALIDLLGTEGWEHVHLGADDLIAGPGGVFVLATKIVPGRAAVEDGALTARLLDDDETVVRYGGLRGRLLATSLRLGRGVRPVVV